MESEHNPEARCFQKMGFSPSSVRETQLNHREKRGKWGWCQGFWGEVNSLGRLDLWEGADIASPAGKPQELLEPSHGQGQSAA